MATVGIVVALVVGLVAGYFVYPAVVPTTEPELQARISELEGDISALEDDISGLQGQISDLQAELAAVPRLEGDIPIGALLSLSGDLRTFGENEQEAMNLAVEEVNQWLTDTGYDFQIRLFAEDTQTKADEALLKLQSLAAQGIKVVLGPLSSSELGNIIGFADANDILVISQSSTDPGLSIPGDNVFRFVSDDTIQGGLAMPGIFEAFDVTHVFPIWRRDAWGDSLIAEARLGAQDIGVTMADGIGFDPDTVRTAGFGPEVTQLVAGVQELVDQHGADNVGVLFIAFELAPDLLEKATQFPILKQVKWVGSDGTAGSGAVLENEIAAEFATEVNWVNPIFGVDRASRKWQRVNGILEDILGRLVESYSFNMYDMVWVVTQALILAGEYDTAKIKAVLPQVAANSYGSSGWLLLNENGDRAFSDYDLWAVREVAPGTFDWAIVGVWLQVTGEIVFFE